jgi:hypothetical protein
VKHKDNSLFDFIGFVLKNNNESPKNYKPPTFLVNRWLSMANDGFCKIINLTTNKWCREIPDFDIEKFYRLILPKYKKRLIYIKKKVKEKELEEDINMASLMECSQREINLFKETLAEFTDCAK